MRNLGPARAASPRGRPGRPQPGVAALVVSRSGDAARALAGALGEQEPLIEIAASLEAADELRRRLRFDLVVVEQEQVDAPVADWVAERRRAGDCTPVILVVDADCSSDEDVILPVATAMDVCGSATITSDAPITFPAGETTVVTYTATDECNNTSTETVDVTVAYGANIMVSADRHTVGSGTNPLSTKEPIVGIEACGYDVDDA